MWLTKASRVDTTGGKPQPKSLRMPLFGTMHSVNLEQRGTGLEIIMLFIWAILIFCVYNGVPSLDGESL